MYKKFRVTLNSRGHVRSEQKKQKKQNILSCVNAHYHYYHYELAFYTQDHASIHPICMCLSGFLFLLTAFFHLYFTPLSFLSLSHWAAVRENKMFSENEIRNIMFQVISGLAFVHKHGKKLYSHSAFRNVAWTGCVWYCC